MKEYVREIFYSEKSTYIFISGLVSTMGFFKSFIFLKYFDFEDLGLVNICQNVILTISLLQVGLVTGGYRIFSYKKDGLKKAISSSVLVSFIFLLIVLLLIGSITVLLFNLSIAWYWVMLFIIIGILSLYANWVNCKLIATRKIGILNKINLLSAVVSLSTAFSSPYIGVSAAIATFLLQSLILIGFAYIMDPAIRPSLRITHTFLLVKRIISIGFIPYLSSAIGYFNTQVGRWAITFTLGTIILGKISLVVLYLSVASVFPNALSNLYFPELISLYEQHNKQQFLVILKRYFFILSFYIFSMVTVTLLLSDFIIGIVFPKHLESLPLVYAALPGIVLVFLVNPVIVVLNSMRKFDHILKGSLVSMFSYMLLIILYIMFWKIRLIDFFIIESISAFCYFIYNYQLIKFVKK